MHYVYKLRSSDSKIDTNCNNLLIHYRQTAPNLPFRCLNWDFLVFWSEFKSGRKHQLTPLMGFNQQYSAVKKLPNHLQSLFWTCPQNAFFFICVFVCLLVLLKAPMDLDPRKMHKLFRLSLPCRRDPILDLLATLNFPLLTHFCIFQLFPGSSWPSLPGKG